ncbi:putative protein C9orf43 [Galemys pyrenaicus]|uniref:Uncharacterized protein n=1 Tax=Galemys pyrenaicus TaxID=202257 RepID=A0A8J6DS66_GALPY|nr:putative protein C9orf43 [Galemys pyrenaicus]
MAMDLPAESQWDETTCNLAICQHPQYKLPVLTIVNISDPCLQAKRHARHRHHLSGLTFTKARSLSRGSKFHSKFQGRPQKDLPAKSLTSRTDRSLKLPVLNLNRTQIPCPQDVRNMVVIWIPEESDNQMIPTEKKHIVPKKFEEKKRKKSAVSSKSSLSRKLNSEKDRRAPRMTVPPPSPVHLFEQLTSRSLPLWNQFDMLPQDLLRDLLSDKGKTTPCPELKTQLAMVNKTLPLEKSRPDSAVSARMFLSIQRLTLQRPMLREPGRLKKLSSNLKTEDPRKQQQQQQQQQQMKVKIPNKKKEAKKKSKSDPGSQDASCEHSGHGTVQDWESDKKQQKQKIKGPILQEDPTERLRRIYTESCLEAISGMENPEFPSAEPMNRGISAQMEFMLGVQKKTPVDFSSYVKTTNWNPELKLLRILQASDEEQNQTSEEENEGTLETQAGGLTEEQAQGFRREPYSGAGCLGPSVE